MSNGKKLVIVGGERFYIPRTTPDLETHLVNLRTSLEKIDPYPKMYKVIIAKDIMRIERALERGNE